MVLEIQLRGSWLTCAFRRSVLLTVNSLISSYELGGILGNLAAGVLSDIGVCRVSLKCFFLTLDLTMVP